MSSQLLLQQSACKNDLERRRRKLKGGVSRFYSLIWNIQKTKMEQKSSKNGKIRKEMMYENRWNKDSMCFKIGKRISLIAYLKIPYFRSHDIWKWAFIFSNLTVECSTRFYTNTNNWFELYFLCPLISVIRCRIMDKWVAAKSKL